MATYEHTTYTTAAATFEYAIGFSYARNADVKVYLDSGSGDVEIAQGSGAGQFLITSSGTKITLGASVGQDNDDTLTIKRVTDISDATTVFTKGSGFTAADANAVINQLLYAIDELQVPAFDTGFLSVDTLVSGAADITYKHNFGALPTRLIIQLKCTDTELGYATNDVIQPGDGALAPIVTATTTDLVARWKAFQAITLTNLTSGGVSAITDSKWSYRIMAWR